MNDVNVAVKRQKIVIITGEASGDLYGAHLVNALKAILPPSDYYAVGGKKMKETGVNIIIDNKPLSVVGAIEILPHLKSIIAAYQYTKKFIRKEKPDVVILIDWPSFNLRMAKIAKRAGCKVIYYISPQIWAWRQGRVKIIKRYVDKMLVLFPFEADFYKRHNVPAIFVGHPLAHKVVPKRSPESALNYFNIDKQGLIIGLAPGSRQNELRYLLPIMLKTVVKIQAHYPNATFILPLASSITAEEIAPYLKNCSVSIKLIDHDHYDALQLCDVMLVTSGTMTLELALLSLPMVIVYKLSPITFAIAKRLVKVKYIGLCNTVAGKKLATELLQKEVNADNLFSETVRLLNDNGHRDFLRKEASKLKMKLGSIDTSQKVAEEVQKMLI